MSQIIIALTTEGTTDIRFLSSIIQRTFIDIGVECKKDIEVVEPIIYIEKEKGNSFVEQVFKCSQQAFENCAIILCVHVDADENTDEGVYQTRITPAVTKISKFVGNICDNVVPIIPVQMTEAWMLADRQLLKTEIGTELSDEKLGLNKSPESLRNPKEVLTESIRIARLSFAKKRRRDLTIAELYQPIGQKISLEMLSKLPSYLKFRDSVRESYRKLNLMQ